MTKKSNRSAKTGKFVTAKYAKKNKATTVTETSKELPDDVAKFLRRVARGYRGVWIIKEHRLRASAARKLLNKYSLTPTKKSR